MNQRLQARGSCRRSEEQHAQTAGAGRCVTSTQAPWHLHRRPKGGAVVGVEENPSGWRVRGQNYLGAQSLGAPASGRSADRASASRGKTSADLHMESPSADCKWQSERKPSRAPLTGRQPG